jgi:hypothetical protein
VKGEKDSKINGLEGVHTCTQTHTLVHVCSQLMHTLHTRPYRVCACVQLSDPVSPKPIYYTRSDHAHARRGNC